MKETITISVTNSYGDHFSKTLENPDCPEIAKALVEASQQLGFSIQCIQSALADCISS